MRHTALSHEFVDVFPDELREGVLYVSMKYATATHLCACGCGNEVVTPIRPAAWHLLFDGKTVSLTPSIGNGQLACRSHYWVDADTVRWTEPLNREASIAAQLRDARDNERYFESRRVIDTPSEQTDTEVRTAKRLRQRLLALIRRWFGHQTTE